MNHDEITQSSALYQSHKEQFSKDSPHKWSMQALKKISPHKSKVSFDTPNQTICGKRSFGVCAEKKYPEVITIDSPTNANARRNKEIERLLLEQEQLIERFEIIKEKICENWHR